MKKHKGWIALDIDGTITDATHHAPKDVVRYLHTLVDQGWEIVFITGRTFSFCYQVVKEFDFPFYLAVQNGADILFMPEKKLIARHYLDNQVIPALEKAYEGEKEDFILYAGFEHGDFCYYRPERFSPAMAKHLEKIIALSPEPWKAVKDFEFESNFSFPLAKCLGTQERMARVNAHLQNLLNLETAVGDGKLTQPFNSESFPTAVSRLNVSSTMIRDPLGDEDAYLILVTTKEATKGKALSRIKQMIGRGGPTIAAGDDLNDISMLQGADIRIVMEAAPPEMLPLATLVGRHGKQHGIIEALTQAISKAKVI